MRSQRLTQEQLAKRVGITQGFISQVEGDMPKEPPLITLQRLAQELKCNVS
jgi:transcriptional regulator with XRE-family HTH domain